MKLVTKVMKGSAEFRETSKSFVQCRNEVFIYDKVIPYLKSFIKNRKTTMEPDEWTPKVFHQFYGKIPGKLRNISTFDEISSLPGLLQSSAISMSASWQWRTCQ